MNRCQVGYIVAAWARLVARCAIGALVLGRRAMGDNVFRHFSGAALPAAAWLLATTCLVAGCAVGPDFHAPAAPAVSRATEKPLPEATQAVAAVDGEAQHFVTGRDVAGDWWAVFRAPRVSALVAAALRQNPSLEGARHTLRQAQETALAAEGAWFPSLSATLNRTRQELSGAEAGFTGAGETFSVVTAQVNVSYNFDVWGQTQRTVEADKAQAEQQRFQLEGAATILAANTASAAINAAGLSAQITAEEALVGAERDLLKTVKRQFEIGATTGSDVATQEAQLANTEALLVPLQTQLAQTRDQIAAYTGRIPSEADIPAFSLDEMTLPETLPVSLPSQLVEQRPDIRASEAQLHTATAQVGVAISNRLPQLTLSGFVGSAPAHFEDLFTPTNGIWSFASQIMGPLFQGGTLLHQQRAAQAALRAASANYRNVVVTAFQNVADVLTALQQDALALAANQDAERAAARSLELTRVQYGAGGVPYLSVLTAETQYQTAVIGLIKARTARYTDTVALFAALGGGWWHRDDLPPPPEGLIRSLLP
jgi:NodT family efflux transporter outer membrane factor (OMF) lipoprotein